MRGRWLAGLFLLILPILPFLVKAAIQPPSELEREALDAPGTQASAEQAHSSPQVTSAASAIAAKAEEFRVELLMSLDLFVRAERALYAEGASYTKALGRVPDVFGSLAQYYKIDIARANQSQLLVVAVGEGRRNAVADLSALVGDRVAVDEVFRVRSNFPMPRPPRDYLHTLARAVMNRIYSDQYRVPGRQELNLLEGIFHGYFRYEVKPVSNGGRTIVAEGIAAPVAGDIVEMQPGANLYDWVYNHRNTSWIEKEIYGNLEKIYLAERVHHEHVGSYSPTFSGLLPMWNDLAALGVEQSPLVVQEFQLDPTFGFHAEVGERRETSGRTPSARSSSTARVLSVNGYGQVAEVSSIETIVNQFEQTRKKVLASGEIRREILPTEKGSGLEAAAKSLVGPAMAPSGDPSGDPLLIDAVDPEK